MQNNEREIWVFDMVLPGQTVHTEEHNMTEKESVLHWNKLVKELDISGKTYYLCERYPKRLAEQVLETTLNDDGV